MPYGEQYIDSVQRDPIRGIIMVAFNTLQMVDDPSPGDPTSPDYLVDHFWEAVIFIETIIEENELDIPFTFPPVGRTGREEYANLEKCLRDVENYCREHLMSLRVMNSKNHYKALLGKSFAYEFSEDDLNRMQVLVNELRDYISQSHGLDENHRRRLLNRLENLQSELHKRVSDLDRFWGLVGDAGVVIGKLGEDAKPIVERIKEIAKIVWNTQARSEELPSDSRNPMLEHDNKEL